MGSQEIILNEIASGLSKIDPQGLKSLIDDLMSARRVLVVGVGRVLISLKAWVKRLAQLDIDINYVGSETEKPVGSQDLLIVASASGESIFPVEIARAAKRHGTKIAYIGCNPQSTAALLADAALIVPGKSKLHKDGEYASMQPMSTLFEQVLYLLCDVIALEIMERKGIDEKAFESRHANLE